MIRQPFDCLSKVVEVNADVTNQRPLTRDTDTGSRTDLFVYLGPATHTKIATLRRSAVES